LARKRALACLFPELVRQSAQAAALVKRVFRDVLNSLWGGCGSWLPSSQNFSVASHYMDEKELPPRGHALERLIMQTATQAIYATIIVNRPLID